MRQKFLHTDSLDFLLDAMCNVFGAILLVAILVAAISGSSMLRKAGRNPAEEERVLREKIALRQAELAAAEAELDLWQSLAAARAPGTAALHADQLPNAQRRNQDLAKEVNELGEKLLALHREHWSNTQKLAQAAEFDALPPRQQAQQLETYRTAIADLQTKIAEAEAAPERFVPHVLAQTNDLQPWRLLVTNAMHEVGPNRAIRAGRPESEAVKIEHFRLPDASYWRLVPVAGTGLAPDALDTEKLLKKAPPERYFMELFCAPNAIAETAQIMRKLRRAGYRVNWRVMPPEGALVAERQGGRYEAQ